MYSYDDLEYGYDNQLRPKVNVKLCVIFAIFAILIIVILLKSFSNSYSNIEKKMVSKASTYVSQHNIVTNKEIYIDVSKLNINLPSNCNLLSGVIYDGNLYKPYLLCDDYESDIIEVKSSDIDLVGNNVILLLKGMKYYELGWKGNRNLLIGGNVLDEEGVYNLFYLSKVNNDAQNRKVIIVDNYNLINNFPKFLNLSSNEKTIIKGEYDNEQLNVVDQFDGNITSKIIKVSNVNTNIVGEYQNIYYARNSMGYTSILEQKVSVVERDYKDSPIMKYKLNTDNMTNEDVIITITIAGSNYQYTILPNKTKIENKEFKYTVNTNGKYDFILVDNNNKEIVKTINITNIDKDNPLGTCEAAIYSDKTKITVDVKSFNYIVGYNYIIDNNESGFKKDSNYVGNKSVTKNVKVKIKDYIGNESTINCNINNKMDNDGIKNIIKGKARLRMPISDALSKKGYSVNDLNKCIYKKVIDAGPGTRYGVVAAAYGLIDCTYSMTGYVLSYNHVSGKVHIENDVNYCSFNSDICGKLGVNTRWGSPGGQCGSSQCWHGLNCATFVRWAMCNGGMNLCTGGAAGAFSMVSTTYFPEADGVYVYGNDVSYYSGRDLTNYSADQIIRMIKPGDVIAHNRPNDDVDGQSQHSYVVIGRDSEGIYTADNGISTGKIYYSSMLDGVYRYRILFLDNYYANSNNKNSLY